MIKNTVEPTNMDKNMNMGKNMDKPFSRQYILQSSVTRKHYSNYLCYFDMQWMYVYIISFFYRTPFVLGTSFVPVKSVACLIATAKDLKAASAL